MSFRSQVKDVLDAPNQMRNGLFVAITTAILALILSVAALVSRTR
jgi:hypothetical protein